MMAALWNMAPCILVEVDISEVRLMQYAPLKRRFATAPYPEGGYCYTSRRENLKLLLLVLKLFSGK
jgi:hypothetical protein